VNLVPSVPYKSSIYNITIMTALWRGAGGRGRGGRGEERKREREGGREDTTMNTIQY
jgi:hypothetical protein